MTGYGLWVVSVAAIVMYLPFERALEADEKFHAMQAEVSGGAAASGAPVFGQ